MPIFRGTLRIAGDVESLPALVSVDAGRLSVRSRSHPIGDWALDSLEISDADDGFHLRIDGEELVLSLADSRLFAETVVPAPARPARSRRPATEVVGDLLHSRAPWVAGALAVVALGVFATRVLALLVLLAGGSAFFGGLLALFEPLLASRLPGRATPFGALVVGVAGILLATLLYAVG